MEVHAHTHTARKKWTHYLWEFLMLFLAVFCGFFAEYQLEHTIEKQKEKQYIKTLIDDISIDTTNINDIIRQSTRYSLRIDSMLYYMDELRINGVSDGFMKHQRFVNDFPRFIYTDRTMQQLKNSGGMRLIHNKDAAISIITYDAAVKDAQLAQNDIYQQFLSISDQRKRIINYRTWGTERKKYSAHEIKTHKTNILITNDKKQFAIFYNYVSEYSGACQLLNDILNAVKEKGIVLIGFLKKEYHLK